jgi:glycosyltransferase 2 family protein
MRLPVPRSRLARAALVAAVAVALVGLAIWHGPDLGVVGEAFGAVEWRWVVGAAALNVLSATLRSLAWKVVLDQALPAPQPRWRTVFSAFSVGLLANVAAPGRLGELARVPVLTRHLGRRRGTWATIVGTIFAHRLFDVAAAVPLVIFVVFTARLPDWAARALAIAFGVGIGLGVAGLLLARRRRTPLSEEPGRVRRLLAMARQGLAVLRSPAPAVFALYFQVLGWTMQLFAVWVAFRAFQIDAPLAAAALVLVMMNAALLFPLWPGNFGLVQVAVALPLLAYGVSYAHGFGFGIGLQAIEASVGVGLGLASLMREGVSFAMLRRMPEVHESERAEQIAVESPRLP